MPVAGGIGALVGLFAGTGTAATVAKAALAAGAIALQVLLAPRRPRQPRPDDLRTTKRSEEGPGRWAIGRVELEGQVLYGNTAGYDLYQIILHCFGPIASIEEYFYDGRVIVVEEGSDEVSSPPFVAPSVGSYLRIETKIGDGTETAWLDLVDTFADYGNDHRLRGIAHTKLRAINPGTTAERFGVMFQGGLKPVRLRARVSLFDHPWDPRLDGGSGARAWTLNAVLIAAHIRALLPGSSFASIDWADMSARASEAEAAVATLSGSAPRATLSGGGEGALTVDVMLEFLRSAGLEEVLAPDGRVRFRWLEDYPAAELHLTADHILGVTLQRGPEGVRRPNVCRVKHLSPERQYTVAELAIQMFDSEDGSYTGPEWARQHNEVARYGEQEMTVELPFCPDASQAQRIARRLFWMERADVLEVVTSFAGVAAYGRRTIDVDVPDLGDDGGPRTLRARLEGWSMDEAAGQCRLVLRVIPDVLQAPWLPSRDEVAPPPVFVAPEPESELETPAAPGVPFQVTMPNGEQRLYVAYTDVPTATVSEANYRTYTGATPDLWQGMDEIGTTLAWIPGNFEGETVDVRVRMFDEDENGSRFSPVTQAVVAIDATPPGHPTDLAIETDPDTGEVTSITAIAPASPQVVKVVISYGATFAGSVELASFGVLPGEAVAVPAESIISPDPGTTTTYFAAAYATGDVVGGVASLEYERPI